MCVCGKGLVSVCVCEGGLGSVCLCVCVERDWSVCV